MDLDQTAVGAIRSGSTLFAPYLLKSNNVSINMPQMRLIFAGDLRVKRCNDIIYNDNNFLTVNMISPTPFVT